MGYERPYYTDLDYHPFLFYILFGVGAEELAASKKRHHVDEFPEGLDLSFLKKSNHGEYMDTMLGGTLGKVLNDKYPRLFETVQRTDELAVIRGEVQKDSDLDISVENVLSNETDIAAKVFNQMIFYGALGAFFSKPVKLHTRNCKACLVTSEFVDDLDNPNFNNLYYTVLWDTCEVEL